MKKRHSAEQIVAKLREAEVELAKGGKVSEVVRKLAIPRALYRAVLDQIRRFAAIDPEAAPT